MNGLDSIAPKLIDQTLREIDKIAEPRKKELINDGGHQVQKTARQLI